VGWGGGGGGGGGGECSFLCFATVCISPFTCISLQIGFVHYIYTIELFSGEGV